MPYIVKIKVCGKQDTSTQNHWHGLPAKEISIPEYNFYDILYQYRKKFPMVEFYLPIKALNQLISENPPHWIKFYR